MTWLHTDRQTDRPTSVTDTVSLYNLVTHRPTERETDSCHRHTVTV